MAEKCPLCGYSLDMPTAVKGNAVTPRPDDLTVCLSCHSILTFKPDLQLRILTKEELNALESDAEFWSELVGVIHAMRTLPRAN